MNNEISDSLKLSSNKNVINYIVTLIFMGKNISS